MSEKGDELFRQFVRSGFEQLVDNQPADLADYLESRAAATGSSTSLFLAEAIRAVYALSLRHDDYGGIRLGFVHQLDDLVHERLPVIERSESHWAAKLARDFRDEILSKVALYDPQKSYD
jgi:hypothetical protein